MSPLSVVWRKERSRLTRSKKPLYKEQVTCFFCQVILSSCSGYFQTILSRTNAPHPVIVMPKDVHLDDISGIVDFMYYGEVAVPTADISRFLAVAEQFQVRGLVEDVPKVSQLQLLEAAF